MSRHRIARTSVFIALLIGMVWLAGKVTGQHRRAARRAALAPAPTRYVRAGEHHQGAPA